MLYLKNANQFPLIAKVKGTRFVSGFYFDVENNNLVCSDGKALIRIPLDKELKNQFGNEDKIIFLNGTEEKKPSMLPYLKVIPDITTGQVYESTLDLQGLIKCFKELKNTQAKIRLSKDLCTSKVLYTFESKPYNFNLDLLLNSLITLSNLIDSQKDIKIFMPSNSNCCWRIFNDNFDICIMSMTGESHLSYCLQNEIRIICDNFQKWEKRQTGKNYDIQLLKFLAGIDKKAQLIIASFRKYFANSQVITLNTEALQEIEKEYLSIKEVPETLAKIDIKKVVEKEKAIIEKPIKNVIVKRRVKQECDYSHISVRDVRFNPMYS